MLLPLPLGLPPTMDGVLITAHYFVKVKLRTGMGNHDISVKVCVCLCVCVCVFGAPPLASQPLPRETHR